MQRDRAYRRWQRNRIVHKKCGLLLRLGGEESLYAWTRGTPGRLAKGKIHCSCWMCRVKSYDWLSHSDLKKQVSFLQQMRDESYTER